MRAALVGLDFGKNDFAASLDELFLLAKSAGAEPVITITGRRASPDAALFVGTGKAQEVADAVADLQLELVIFNHALSPAQQRNLERVLKVRVLDRTSLILDIFAQRAKSHEGKVQVELAQLQHLSTRLIRGWTHLERQKGGIGLRGPGETQLETDRRLLGERVKALRAVLAKLRRQHATQRRARGRSETFSVSLVGYTNAGKSTIFNADQGRRVCRQPAVRHAGHDLPSRLPGRGRARGDFRHRRFHPRTAAPAGGGLPRHAGRNHPCRLLLHVVDAASPVRMEQIEQVNLVLKEIGADHVPQILVWNKIDAAGLEPAVEYDEYGKIQRVFVSAKSGAGLDLLREAIAASLKAALEARVAAVPSQSIPKTCTLEPFEGTARCTFLARIPPRFS
jgi:GTP-binding protein HflX